MSELSSKRLARLNGRPTGTVAALDIGCSKTTCLIARPDTDNPRRMAILGGGRQQTRGFAGGTITDMEAIERSIRLAVEDAEREAGEPISEVILGITGPKLSSRLVSASLEISGRAITAKDVRRLHAQALSRAAQTAGGRQEEILSAWPVVYTIDKAAGRVRQPVGMIAGMLSVKMSIVSAPRAVVTNLVECVGRAHLVVRQLVPSAIASGAGTLIEDEIENGAVCIDLGSGVTAVSVFLHGSPAWLGLVPAGGAHVTADIAQGIGTTFAAAERLKMVFGTADLEGPGLAERIEAPRLGDDGRLHASRLERGEIARIIAPRIEEIFELAQNLLAQSDVRSVLPQRVVLTGGASQLPGIREVASRILKTPIRLGRPVLAESLGEQLATPAFSTASGLLLYPELGFTDAARAGASSSETEAGGSPGWTNAVLHWLKENF
ncbi:MAG: cell division protein FtsA [Hyphomonas sp.]|uniref:cell division protein FtsA n=1 Tax=Hyphomonas sp. TaxID=87 RepID=UPI001793A008|nr:cell division protein FtsA [Hyphomonas sp.]MBU3919591.1 cell division protein FtsA [Alphaproteobacteria bacterium]MBA3068424.1 cell division protein FtsA [Hyphomonas sp.]MBU4060708.1 cell division protein FtsA [Alphaproteobacteria bacterium]MBU4164692.1 cell division protein FtsA [Alphaproteobacteria bacterium]MBU4567813.1 cell division protein FtsA [Alphaproteobacteria bacterium]